jgi:hypothetical protein
MVNMHPLERAGCRAGVPRFIHTASSTRERAAIHSHVILYARLNRDSLEVPFHQRKSAIKQSLKQMKDTAIQTALPSAPGG